MKQKIAYAIVYKKRPSINLNEIYSKEQIKDCFVEKDEMVVEVVIMENVGMTTVRAGKCTYSTLDYLK